MNIRIKEGTYKIRGKETDMAGLVFPMVEEFKVGASGGWHKVVDICVIDVILCV